MRHQSCLWHGWRDFPYILYADKLNKAQRQPLEDKLKSIPALNLNQADFEELTPKDLPKVKKLAEKTEQGFKELIEALPEDKYPKARAYIENLSRNVITFFDIWFAKGFCTSLNTNAIESASSQVKKEDLEHRQTMERGWAHEQAEGSCEKSLLPRFMESTLG
ncbi:MAG: hypothetical protein DRQ02_11610 [Candidatus Latescibacterota bacterium]|nr:MAG: hypothetical protein DRQ02_11610 [Candidatus Latescibacterota bacterium]